MIAVQKKEKPIILFDSTTLGKFNIEVQSVDMYNLNNLYLKTPRDQVARSPHKRSWTSEKISNA